jgi:hypothetical protein
MPTTRPEPRSVLYCRYTTNRDQQPFGKGHLHDHPGRGIRRKVFGKEAVYLWKIGNIGHQYGGVHDKIEAAPSCLQDRVEVSKCLPGLSFEGRSRCFAGGRVHTGLTGNKQ